MEEVIFLNWKSLSFDSGYQAIEIYKFKINKNNLWTVTHRIYIIFASLKNIFIFTYIKRLFINLITYLNLQIFLTNI